MLKDNLNWGMITQTIFPERMQVTTFNRIQRAGCEDMIETSPDSLFFANPIPTEICGSVSVQQAIDVR